MDYLDIIRDSFSYCKSEELAYIMTRTKGEKFLLAKLGYYIDRILDSNLFIQLEKSFFDRKKINLTILDRDKEPPDDLLCALEAKIYYSFDLGKNFNSKVFDNNIQKLNRLREFGYIATKKILMVLFTHYGEKVPNDFIFEDQHNFQFRKHGSYGLSELIQNWIKNYFENKNLRQKRYLLGNIGIGNYKTIPLALFYGILEFI